MTTGRRPTKKSPLRRPFVVTVAIGIPTLVAFGCGTSKPGAGPGGSSGGPPVPPPTSDGSCTQEGATQTCHVDLGRTAGLQSCFYGTQSCLGGRWTPCGGAGKIINSTADNLATALQQAGLASQLQVLSGAAASIGDASTGSSLCAKTCLGGANDKGICATSADCPAIQCSKVCIGGSDAGKACTSNGNCNSNNCSAGKKCIGGTNAGAACVNNGGCPGSGTAGTCSSNDVCNPNCQGWDLNGTPEGGISEAGVGVSGFGQIPGGQLNALLDDACHPGGSSTCVQTATASTLYQCQLDTYCDIGTGCCKQFPVGSTMNGTVNGPGVEAAGVDLTMGPGCCDNCRTYRDFPLCNRGDTAIPLDTPIASIIVTPNTAQNPCPTYAFTCTGGSGSPTSGLSNGQCCTYVDAAHGADPTLGLLPGQCLLMNMSTDCKGGEPTGEQWIYTNANQAITETTLTNNPVTVPADTPACANNWSDHNNGNNPPSCRTSSSATSFVQDFTASCPVGYVVQWTNLTWSSQEFSSGGSNTEILFEAATAPLQTDGGIGGLSPYYEIGEASLGTSASGLDQANCDFTGPVTANGCTNSDSAGAQDKGSAGAPCCPKNFTNQFIRPTTVTSALFPGAGPTLGLTYARQAYLSMRITTRDTSDGKASPILNNWSIDFTCVPNE